MLGIDERCSRGEERSRGGRGAEGEEEQRGKRSRGEEKQRGREAEGEETRVPAFARRGGRAIN
jgi:hypothetical protein